MYIRSNAYIILEESDLFSNFWSDITAIEEARGRGTELTFCNYAAVVLQAQYL